jgi:flagellar basal body-associated protein FliL
MRNSKLFRVLITLAVVVMLTAAFSVTAFAYTDPEAEQTEEPAATATPEVTPEPTAEPTPTPPPAPLTPDGNLTLVDDLSGTQTEGKQFITVVTKNGNYFYIIIDRAGDKENVHFLNLVDEADLMALLEDAKQPAPVTPPAAVTPEPETEPTPAPEPEQKNNTGGLVILLVLVAALGGGAFYYFKVVKPKQGTKGNTAVSELDDFDFDEDEPEYTGLTDGAADDYDGGDADEEPAADEDFDIGEPPEMEDRE